MQAAASGCACEGAVKRRSRSSSRCASMRCRSQAPRSQRDLPSCIGPEPPSILATPGYFCSCVPSRRDCRIMCAQVEVPQDLIRYIAPKGFIAVDGTSLTVCEVNNQECWFTFMLVAYTQVPRPRCCAALTCSRAHVVAPEYFGPIIGK